MSLNCLITNARSDKRKLYNIKAGSSQFVSFVFFPTSHQSQNKSKKPQHTGNNIFVNSYNTKMFTIASISVALTQVGRTMIVRITLFA